MSAPAREMLRPPIFEESVNIAVKLKHPWKCTNTEQTLLLEFLSRRVYYNTLGKSLETFSVGYLSNK